MPARTNSPKQIARVASRIATIDVSVEGPTSNRITE